MERVEDLHRQSLYEGNRTVGEIEHAAVTAKLQARKKKIAAAVSAPVEAPAPPAFHPDAFKPAPKAADALVLRTAALGIAGGLVFAAYSSLPPSQAAARSATVAMDGLTCWTEPGVNAGLVEEIPEGEVVRVAESRNGWTQVLDKGCWAKESKLIFS
ncbi:MAG: hypothetical protein QHC67_05710 [Sphingobium sp.]|uniref:hypothetical protein n=1 Tax=Sphingobium sp. TaxID=1912891 RepID=UPI0029AE9211|nr:hypothetical protein [Sphingobium sp.]MDX3909298.1 hypothetical protein [Sphingobium sp.]